MLIFVDSAICSSEMPRFRRIVTSPKTPFSSFIKMPFPSSRGGSRTTNKYVINFTLYHYLRPLLNSFFMGICRREFGACLLAGMATRLLALPVRPKLFVLVILDQFRPDYLDSTGF